MSLNLTGDSHVELNDALRKHIEEKYEQLKEHFPALQNVHVVLKKDHRLHYMSEINLHITGAPVMHGRGKNIYSLENAINAMIDKIKRRAAAFKEKHLAQHHRSQRHA